MLTQRQEEILQAIVRHYTTNGQPVGSKALVNQLHTKVSSATIRNEMATLERAGLVVKEHSSSGRVPAQAGYRYYVDHLLNPAAVTESDLVVIQNSLGADDQRLDELVSHSAELLSNLTSYTAFTLKPEQRDAHLSGFRLVPLGNHKVVAILVTDTGTVESQSVTLPAQMDTGALEAVVRLINDQLTGLPLATVAERLTDDIPLRVAHYLRRPEGLLDVFDTVASRAAHERFYVGGRLNLLGFSSQQNPAAVQDLYKILDHRDSLEHLLDQEDGRGPDLSVRIGHEIAENRVLNDYSLITAKYRVNQYGEGIIAVLGPTRMPYSRTIGLVNAFREELARRLLDYYRRYYDS